MSFQFCSDATTSTRLFEEINKFLSDNIWFFRLIYWNFIGGKKRKADDPTDKENSLPSKVGKLIF